MAVTKLDYIPGSYEAITDEPLDDTPVLNTWYHFTIEGWSHAMSDIALKQGGSVIPTSAYELTIDTKYTAREVSESGKTLYGLWRIVDGTYDAIATTISGNNFASYVSNENVQAQIDAIPPIPTIPTSYVFASIASQIFADTTPFFPNITESVDNDNEFTANTFTAKVAGLFSAKFSGSLFFNGTTGVNQRQEIDILKNGSSISMAGWEGAESRTVDLCTTIDIELAVGETLTFSCVANSAVSYENKILEGRISITQLR